MLDNGETIEENENFENISVSKKFRTGSKCTMISAAVCALIILLPNIINAQTQISYTINVNTDLPWIKEWDDYVYYDVTVNVLGVQENMTLVIYCELTQPFESYLLVNGVLYGNLEYPNTIFVVPIIGDVDLEFNAFNMWVKIDKIGDDLIVNNSYDDVAVKGKTYAEKYQAFNYTSGTHEGYNAMVSVPTDNRHRLTVYPIEDPDVKLEYMAITESGISDYSVITDTPEERNLSAGVKGVKISSTYSERFLFNIEYMEPDPLIIPHPIINFPDLFVSSEDIMFSDDSPTQGDIIWLNVTVHNIGKEMADNFNVILYLDIVNITTMIGNTDISLNGDSSVRVDFEWDTTDIYGNHIIRVLLDQDNYIVERNESNHAMKYIFIDDPVEVSKDDDLDGLPDYWELKYGLDNMSAIGDDGADGDPDKDNLTNIQEFENITDPVNPDTDGDFLLDGINNSLIELKLINITRKYSVHYPPYPINYYIMMNQYRIMTGQIFPFSGYRVPVDTFLFWMLATYATLYPGDILCIAYIVENMPLYIYEQDSTIPISEFYITVSKDELEINKTINITLGDDIFILTIEATLLEYAFSDPDPLAMDADWDIINDTAEIIYLSTRVLDFRFDDADMDGTVNYLDVDSDNDDYIDGMELQKYTLREPGPPYDPMDGVDMYADPLKYQYVDTLPSITDPLDPDTDDDALMDGDEIFTYATDPLDEDTDNDGLWDGLNDRGEYPYFKNEMGDVLGWFYYDNISLDEDYYDSESRTSIDVNDFHVGHYETILFGEALLTDYNEEYLPKTLNITNFDGTTHINCSYVIDYETQELDENETQVNFTCRFEFDVVDDSKEILIAANGSILNNTSFLKIYLNYSLVRRIGANPLSADTDNDGLDDFGEYLNGTSPVKSDTDGDSFWDNAEVKYWMSEWDLNILEAVNRSKISDFDDDGLIDGYEVIFNMDPTDDDPDMDELKDYHELFDFVLTKKVRLSDNLLNVGQVTQNFEIKDKAPYLFKFSCEDSINISDGFLGIYTLGDIEFLQDYTDSFMTNVSNITFDKGGETWEVTLSTGGSITNAISIPDNRVLINETRYFATDRDLEPGIYNITYILDVPPEDPDAMVKINLEYFYISRQGLDPLDPDWDKDDLLDGEEVKIGSNPFEPDTDEDGIDDFEEIYPGNDGYITDPTNPDTDGDGFVDGEEINTGEDGYLTDPSNPDTDNDGLWDGPNINQHTGEYSIGTNPTLWDTDGDSMPDGWEYSYDELCSPDPRLPDGGADPDTDGLNNSQEYTVDTNPVNQDTDNDNLTDGDEILGGSFSYGVKYRTNVTYGAKKIDSYHDQIGFKWIFYDGNGYEYYDNYTDVPNSSSSRFNDTMSIMIAILEDGTTIYLNSTTDEIFVWEPNSDYSDLDENGTLEGTYYLFVPSSSIEILTFNEPAEGFRDQEIYMGTDPFNPDTDGDKIYDGDEKEWWNDTDEDGLQNNLDTDSDGDGVDDGEELDWDLNTDEDSILYNMIDTDSDNDGIEDGTEPLWYDDIDKDGLANMLDPDSDNDCIDDGVEDWNYNGSLDENETNMLDADTDNDGVIDGIELDWDEDTDCDLLINALDTDSDNDSVSDGNEVRVVYRTNATNGQFDEQSWVAVATNPDAWDPDSNPLLYYPLFGFAVNSTPPGDFQGIYLGKTPQDKSIYYNATDEELLIDNQKFSHNDSSKIVHSIHPVLTFAKKHKEVLIFFNVSDDDNLPNFLDNDSDDDGLIDGLEDLNNNGILDRDETDPYWFDTDGDGLSDGMEDSNLSATIEEGETDPLDVDSDGDGLWDGWKDEDNDAVYDPWEYGEDTNANGNVDTGETDPLKLDSDEDGLTDAQETRLGVYWLEAENYKTSSATIVDNGNATTDVEIEMERLPNGTYQLFVKAERMGQDGAIQMTVQNITTDVIVDETLNLLSRYFWYNTTVFNLSEEDLPLTIKIIESTGTVAIDKIMLIHLSDNMNYELKVDEFIEGSKEKTLTFPIGLEYESDEFIIIPDDMHVISAKMELDPLDSNIENVSIDIGDDENFEWNYSGKMEDQISTPELADELNQYLFYRRCNPSLFDQYTFYDEFYNLQNWTQQQTIQPQVYYSGATYSGLESSAQVSTSIQTCWEADDGKLKGQISGYSLIYQHKAWIDHTIVYPFYVSTITIDTKIDQAVGSNYLQVYIDNEVPMVFGSSGSTGSGTIASVYVQTYPQVVENYDWQSNPLSSSSKHYDITLSHPTKRVTVAYKMVQMGYYHCSILEGTGGLLYTKIVVENITVTPKIKGLVPITFGASSAGSLKISNISIILQPIVTDPSDDDTDDDGLIDGNEKDILGLSPFNPDSDDDGILDGTELSITVYQGEDTSDTFVPDADSSSTTLPLDRDSDNDGLLDGFKDENKNRFCDSSEFGEDRSGNGNIIGENETDPNHIDTDRDGLTDMEGENWDGDASLETWETSPLDVDTDDDGLWDGFSMVHNGAIYLGELSIGTKPLDNDTDDDGIQDGTELCLHYNQSGDNILDDTEAHNIQIDVNGTNLSIFVSDVDTKHGTDPLDNDTDNDTLADGWIDGWGEFGILDGLASPTEGEDFNGNGGMDPLETAPYRFDTDSDRINDTIEVRDNVYWFEAEDNLGQGAKIWDDDDGTNGIKIIMPDESKKPVRKLGTGNYLVFVKMNSTVTSPTSLTFIILNKTGVTLTDKTVDLKNELIWYRSEVFTIDDDDLPIKIKAPDSGADDSVYIDEIMLINISYNLLINTIEDSNIVFTETELEYTTFVNIPIETYVIDATMQLNSDTNHPKNTTMDVGCDNDTQWYHAGKFFGSEVTFDFSDEINEWIFTNRTNFTDGKYRVPIKFVSNCSGSISISNVYILLRPDVTDPLRNDTDGDCIPDYYEIYIYYTSSLDLDSDDDMLGDFQEIMNYGTYPGDHDTDNDWLYDGFLDIDQDEKFDMGIEVGEDVNLNSIVDPNETDALDPDSDNDSLLDGTEVTAYALWFEAERHALGEIITDNEAANNSAVINSTGTNLIIGDSFPSLPQGDYFLYVKAKSYIWGELYMEYFTDGLGDDWEDSTDGDGIVEGDDGYLNITYGPDDTAYDNGNDIAYAYINTVNVPSSGNYRIIFDYKYPAGIELNDFLVWGLYNETGNDLEIWQDKDKLYVNEETDWFASLPNTIWHRFEIVSGSDDIYQIYLDNALIKTGMKEELGDDEILGKVGDLDYNSAGKGSWDNIRLIESSHITLTADAATDSSRLHPLSNEYEWYSTDAFEISLDGLVDIDIDDSDSSRATACLDKLMLVRMEDTSSLVIETTSDSDDIIVFTENDQNITVYLDIKVLVNVQRYVLIADMSLSGDKFSEAEPIFPEYPYLNLGNDPNICIPRKGKGIEDLAEASEAELQSLENMTLPQWAWYFGEFMPANGTQRLLDLAGELNKYIIANINEPGAVDETGVMRIPLVFHSDTKGKLIIEDLYIELGPYLMDPMDNDTDGDWLLDGDEIFYSTYPIKLDSDNDGLWDVVEPVEDIGTNPLDSDTENDLIMDGNSDELKVIFRAGAVDGSFEGYNDSTWIVIQNLRWVALLGVFAFSSDNAASRLNAYGYVGEIYELPPPEECAPIVFNTSEDYGLYLDNITGNIYVEVEDDVYRNYSASSVHAQSAVNLTWPLREFAINDQEVYSNAALTADKDGDGMIDGIEFFIGLSNTDADCDDDGLFDGLEYYLLLTNPLDPDTDNDNVQDGTELGKTLNDIFVVKWSMEVNELIWGTNLDPNKPNPNMNNALTYFIPDEDPCTLTHPLMVDTDQDGLWDGYYKDAQNIKYGEDIDGNGNVVGEWQTDPTNPDTDGDGLTDGYGENWDGDADLENGETHPLDIDTDDDGLWDGYTTLYNNINYTGELSIGTAPRNNDTDSDNVQDGTEIALYNDSLHPESDNILNDYEAKGIGIDINGTETIIKFISDDDIATVTDPLDDDTDDDGIKDGTEDVNVNGRFDGLNDTDWTLHETDPLNKDTDFDGITDGIEDKNKNGLYEKALKELDPNDRDTDDDGVVDGEEREWCNDTDEDGYINAIDPDSDEDGVIDGIEIGITQSMAPISGFGYNGTNLTIYLGDQDQSTTTDPLNPDTDGDGLLDGIEDKNGNGSYDGLHPTDPTLNETDPLDTDSDNDGVNDGDEDYDLDGIFEPKGKDNTAGNSDDELNPNDCDTDDDAIKDGRERDWNIDTDKDGLINALDADSDGDGIIDGIEMGIYGSAVPQGLAGYYLGTEGYAGDADSGLTKTDPLKIDSDGDGLPDGWIDGWEYTRVDGWFYNASKKDSNFDQWEGEDYDFDGATSSTETNCTLPDTDDDGIPDGIEALHIDLSPNLDPLDTTDSSEDMDSDGLTNIIEYIIAIEANDLDIDLDNDDSMNFNDDNDDGDLIDTGDELYYGLDPYFDDMSLDLDSDGLSNEYEWRYDESHSDKLDLSNFDTDYDGLWDGWQDDNGNQVYDAWEIKGEVGDLTNEGEGGWGTDPLVPDTDCDGVLDGDEVNGWIVYLMEGEIEIYVTSDPTDMDKDTDGDGVLDGDEYLISNPRSNDTDFDGLKDSIDNDLTEVEDIPPKVNEPHLDAEVIWKTKWVGFVPVPWVEHVWLDVRVVVSDNAEVDYVVIIFKDTGKKITIENDGDDTYSTRFEIDFWCDYIAGYEIEIIGYDVVGNEGATTAGGGLSYLIGKLVAGILAFFTGPVISGTIMGFFIGFASGLFEDLTIFLQLGEIFEGFKSLGSLIPQLLSNPGMIFDMIKNMIFGVIHKARLLNPFGYGSISIQEWADNIIALMADFFDNWNVDNGSLGRFISADRNLYTLAFTAAHIVGYLIQQFIVGGAGLVFKTAGKSIVSSIKAVKSALKTSKTISKVAGKAARVAKVVAEGFSKGLGKAISKLKSSGKLAKWSDTAIGGFIAGLARRGRKWIDDILVDLGIKHGDDVVQKVFDKFPDNTDEIEKMISNLDHNFPNIAKGAQGEVDYLMKNYDNIVDIKPSFGRKKPDFIENFGDSIGPTDIKNYDATKYGKEFIQQKSANTISDQMNNYHQIALDQGWSGKVKLVFTEKMPQGLIDKIQLNKDTWLEIVNG